MVAAATKTYTPEDLLTMPDGDQYELVDGQFVERNVSALSSFVATRTSAAVVNFNDAAKLGWTFGDNTSFQSFPANPKMVRKPDAAFIAASRMTADDVRMQGHITIVPDLVLEVVSPNDLAYDVNRRIEEWLDAGVKVERNVQVHRADATVSKLRATEQLSAEEVLPGFRCPIASLFP